MLGRKKPKIFEASEAPEEPPVLVMNEAPEIEVEPELIQPIVEPKQEEQTDEQYVARFREGTSYGSSMRSEVFAVFAKEWLAHRKTESMSALFRPRTYRHLIGNDAAFGRLRETLTRCKPSAEGKGFVVLCGPHGLGKTCALECIANDAKRRYLMPTGHYSESKGIVGNFRVTNLPMKPNYGREAKDHSDTVDFFASTMQFACSGKYDLYFDQCETYAFGCESSKRHASKAFFEGFLKAYDRMAAKMSECNVWVVFAFSGDTFRSSLGCRALTNSKRCEKITLRPFENATPRRLWVDLYARPMMLTRWRNDKGLDFDSASKLCGSAAIEDLKQRTGLQIEGDDEGFNERREQSLASLCTRVELFVRWHDGFETKTELGSKDPTLLGVDLYEHLKRLFGDEDIKFGTYEASMTAHVETSTLHHAATQLMCQRDQSVESLSDYAERWSELDTFEDPYRQEEGSRYWILKHVLNSAHRTTERKNQKTEALTFSPALLANKIKEHKDRAYEASLDRIKRTNTLPCKSYEYDFEYETRLLVLSQSVNKRKRDQT